MGNLIIDKSKYKVLQNNKDLLLSPQEFEILWLLASKPAQVISLEEIAFAICKGQIKIAKGKIQFFVQQLNKKLGKDFILNESINGYRMNTSF